MSEVQQPDTITVSETRVQPDVIRLLREEMGTGEVHWRIIIANGIMTFLPYMSAKRIRCLIYRLVGFHIGARTLIYGKINILGHGHIYSLLRIGDACRVNTQGSRIHLDAPVTIGNGVVLGSGLTIVTGSHQMNDPKFRGGPLFGKPVVIQDGAWLAANVTVLPGVTIGAGAVVGSGSIVVKDVPANTLVAGNPARIIRSLNEK
jgi:maltose O-acetyltransferase